jgi:hypothetical protein
LWLLSCWIWSVGVKSLSLLDMQTKTLSCYRYLWVCIILL